MNIELISVGNELLIGHIVDTNSAYLARKVTELGLKCIYKTTVGDDKDVIVQAIRNALTRANIVIITGGLGPTIDDLTTEAMADVFNKPLVYKVELADKIMHMFKSRGLDMPESNLKQAYIPEGALILNNPVGTASGIYWDVSKQIKSNQTKVIIAFPGVPKEMEYLWNHSVKSLMGQFLTKKVYSKFINFVGISETHLCEKISTLMNRHDPVIYPYANNCQIQLRVFSEQVDFKQAKLSVDNVVKQIENLVGNYIFGYDNTSLEESVSKILINNNLTLAIAESCTGGLVSSRMTDIPGSSAYTLLNVVTYSNKSKQNLLNVPANILEQFGAVSEQVVECMARNVRKLSGADIGLAISGVAGPSGGAAGKPVGLSFIAVAYGENVIIDKVLTNPELSRDLIKWRFSQHAIDSVRKLLVKECCFNF